MKKKVIFCTPTLTQPTAPYIRSLRASLPHIEKAGWKHQIVFEIGNPYVSVARATMTRKALTAGADVLLYLDYDLSWRPKDLVTLLETEGDVVCGTYRFKKEPEEYMGALNGTRATGPIIRADGAISMAHAPAGFLKVTRGAIRAFMRGYPELMYGHPENASIDLFNHGASKWTWYGEDYAFCRRWTDLGGQVWCVPDLNINHHAFRYVRRGHKRFEVVETVFRGNFHRFLKSDPEGYKK